MSATTTRCSAPTALAAPSLRAAVELATDVESLRRVLRWTLGDPYRVMVADDGGAVGLRRIVHDPTQAGGTSLA